MQAPPRRHSGSSPGAREEAGRRLLDGCDGDVPSRPPPPYGRRALMADASGPRAGLKARVRFSAGPRLLLDTALGPSLIDDRPARAAGGRACPRSRRAEGGLLAAADRSW